MSVPAALSSSAASSLASLLVERLDLQPPVDVRSILEARARIEEVQWPFDAVDGLCHQLGDQRPTVFLRSGMSPSRLRFTMGHELGHLVVPWHVGQSECKPGNGAKFGLTTFGQEGQADIFASAVLMPERWLRSLVITHRNSMTDLLEQLTLAEVSTSACLAAVRNHLPPGWIFAAYGGAQAWTTPGTKYPIHGTYEILQHARSEALERGQAKLNGFPVQWFRMLSRESVAKAPKDDRNNITLLRSAIADHFDSPADRLRAEQRANGRVGGALRKAKGQDADLSYADLCYRFQNSDLDFLLEHPEFHTWLARKAQEIESK